MSRGQQSTIEKRHFCTFAARNEIILDHENYQGKLSKHS